MACPTVRVRTLLLQVPNQLHFYILLRLPLAPVGLSRAFGNRARRGAVRIYNARLSLGRASWHVLWTIKLREVALFQGIAFRLAEPRRSFDIPSTSGLCVLLNIYKACHGSTRTVFGEHRAPFEAKTGSRFFLIHLRKLSV